MLVPNSSAEDLENFREVLREWNHQILYRVENPNLTANRYDGNFWQDEEFKQLVWQWFSPDLDYVLNYVRKNQKEEWVRLLAVLIPNEDFDKYHVSNHDIARDLDVEPNNYIIPTWELECPMVEIWLDEVEKITGNFMKAREIKTWVKSEVWRILHLN